VVVSDNPPAIYIVYHFLNGEFHYNWKKGFIMDKNNTKCYSDDDYIYVKWYIHWRTGKKMVASDYGYDAWRFRKKPKKSVIK
jgi:hypothetical protein